MKELDDKNGVKDDAVGRIVRAKNQRAIIDCADANNNTPLSEAASKLTTVLLAPSQHGVRTLAFRWLHRPAVTTL